MFDLKFIVFLAVGMTLSVSFINGFTDAPNAITSVVVTRTLKLKTAVLFAAFADFFGALVIGLTSGKVTLTISNIVSFGNDVRTSVISIFSAMLSVVIWAVAAWFFGIPTSESHALIAGLSGASVAVNGGFTGIDFSEWKKVLYGLVISLIIGFFAGYFISCITVKLFRTVPKNKSDSFFKYLQIISSFAMSFMHGAQDSQKFAGVLMLIIVSSNISVPNFRLPIIMLCSVIIALGTAAGGEKIIKSVGMDMLNLRKDQGFSADMAGSVCLLISTLAGFPVSTTHTKTSAIMGVGAAKSIKSVNWRVAAEMVLAWILTFPCCSFLGWLTAIVFLKIIN